MKAALEIRESAGCAVVGDVIEPSTTAHYRAQSAPAAWRRSLSHTRWDHSPRAIAVAAHHRHSGSALRGSDDTQCEADPHKLKLRRAHGTGHLQHKYRSAAH